MHDRNDGNCSYSFVSASTLSSSDLVTSYSFYKSGAQPPRPPTRCQRRVQVERASISITFVFSSPPWSSNITLSRHHAYLTIIVLSFSLYCCCHHCFSPGSLLLLDFSSPCSKNKKYLFDSNLFSMSTPALLFVSSQVLCVHECMLKHLTQFYVNFPVNSFLLFREHFPQHPSFEWQLSPTTTRWKGKNRANYRNTPSKCNFVSNMCVMQSVGGLCK